LERQGKTRIIPSPFVATMPTSTFFAVLRNVARLAAAAADDVAAQGVKLAAAGVAIARLKSRPA
jgi:hypothetical protein